MEREREVHVGEDPLFDHRPGTVESFFAGLEHEPHGAREFVTAIGEDACRADEHRGVGVVSARVHRAADLARELEASIFRHRQRVHVGT